MSAGQAAGRRGYRFFKVIGYRTKLSGARNALTYAAFRSEGARQGGIIFDPRTDSADVKSFLRDLDDPVSRHPRAAKAYHALFSLPTDLHQRAGIQWPDVVREVMRGYEIQTGRRLHWIAVEHPDPRHRHVHLVIKAVYHDPTGRSRRLFLNRQEIERVKGLVGRALEARGIQPELSRSARDAAPRPHGRPPDARATAVGMVMDWLQRSIKANQRKRQQEEERARQEAERRSRSDRGR